jgi:hypothetical protein
VGTTAAKRRTTSVTEEMVDEEDEPQAWDEAPLFAELDRKSKHIDMVSVRRTEPASGYLGTMPPDVSEASLFSKWGGGSYILEGKSADTRIVPNARRQLKLAGDPIFKGEVEEMEWRRANGLPPKVALAAVPAAEAISTRDLLVMIEEKEERRRAEQLVREDRARAEQTEREDRERRTRAELAAQEKKDADERKAQEKKDQEEREDRRARAQREDDERRARIHREDMERLQAQNAAQLAQSQQFFQQLATTMAAKHKDPDAGEGGAVKALLTGLQVARDFMGSKGGGDDAEPAAKPPDMLTSLIQRLPETLAEVRKTAGGIHRELTGQGAAAAPAGVKPGEDFLTITGPTASKAKKVIQALMAAGKDPELELSRMLSMAATALAPSPPRPAPSSSRPAPAAVDRTDAPSPAPEGLLQKKGPLQRQHRRGRVTVAGGSARPNSLKVAPVVRRPAARAAARRRRKGAA